MAEERVNYKYIDAARGLALMVIITSHATGGSLYITAAMVQTFFVISGYLYRPGRSYGETIKKRARRLLVPYFGYSALLLAFYAVVRRNLGETLHSLFGVFYARFYLFEVTSHEDPVALMDIANGALWYLPAFFVTELLFCLIADKCLASWKVTAFWTAVLMGISMALSLLPILLPWSIDFAGATTIMMLAGAWLKQTGFYERKDHPAIVALVVLLYVFVLNFNVTLNSSVRLYGRFGAFSVPLYLVISICGGMLYIWVAKWIQNTIIGDFFRYIGVHSMELLCIHMVVLEVFEVVVGHFVDVWSFSAPVHVAYTVVRVGVAIVASLIGGRVIAALGKRIRKAA